MSIRRLYLAMMRLFSSRLGRLCTDKKFARHECNDIKTPRPAYRSTFEPKSWTENMHTMCLLCGMAVVNDILARCCPFQLSLAHPKLAYGCLSTQVAEKFGYKAVCAEYKRKRNVYGLCSVGITVEILIRRWQLKLIEASRKLAKYCPRAPEPTVANADSIPVDNSKNIYCMDWYTILYIIKIRSFFATPIDYAASEHLESCVGVLWMSCAGCVKRISENSRKNFWIKNLPSVKFLESFAYRWVCCHAIARNVRYADRLTVCRAFKHHWFKNSMKTKSLTEVKLLQALSCNEAETGDADFRSSFAIRVSAEAFPVFDACDDADRFGKTFRDVGKSWHDKLVANL